MEKNLFGEVRWVGHNWVSYLVVFLVGGLLALYGDPFYVQTALGINLLVILAISWDILARTGQISFGTAAFFGIGTYSTAILHVYLGVIGSWMIGIILAIIVALLFGMALLRLKGMYFAITTFAFSLTLPVLALVLSPITGGGAGINPYVFWGGDRRLQLLTSILFLVIAMVISDWFLQLRLRAAAFLIRSHPELASSSGIPVVKTKIIAFGVSGGLAALAGALYGGLYGFIVPEDAFNPLWSVLPFAIALLGGVDSTFGPIIGGIVLRILEEETKGIIGSYGYQMAVGAAIILCITLMPDGILGLFSKLVKGRVNLWKRS